MEIGSVYEINPQAVERADLKKARRLMLGGVEKYKKQNIVYTASGREAISLALYSLEKEIPQVCKKCLMPAYMCDTVFIPFEKAGWELVFYHVGKDMKANLQELERLVTEHTPGMLFVHSYYGVDTWEHLRPTLKRYQRDGLLLMEDVTQSYYLQTDYTADYIVGSLRKWYAVTDGGFVATDRLLVPKLLEHGEEFAHRRLNMQTRKWQYLKEIQSRPAFDAMEKQEWVEKVLPRLTKEKEGYLAENRQLEEELDHYKKPAAVSQLASNMLMLEDEKACEERRKTNYGILYKGLKDKRTITLIFPECTTGTAPLYFPVYMEDRDELQRYLREQDIYVPVLWPVGNENGNCLSEDEQYIFSHLAAIPLDQRYGEEDMKRIVDVINEYEKLL